MKGSKATQPIPNADFDGLIGFDVMSSYTLLKQVTTKNGNHILEKKVVLDGKTINPNKMHRQKKSKGDNLDAAKTNHKSDDIDAPMQEPKLDDIKAPKKKSKLVARDTSEKKRKLDDIDVPEKKQKLGNKKVSEPPSKKSKSDGNQNKKTSSNPDRNLTHKNENLDMGAWKPLFVPEPILVALQSMGFEYPTEIQKQTIAAAICSKRDIVGAAETGSGKTLAFAIPIIHGILQDRHMEKISPAENSEALEEGETKEETWSDIEDEDELLWDDEQQGSEDEERGSEFESDMEEDVDTESKIGCVRVLNDVDMDFLNEKEPQAGQQQKAKSKLRALIITPTRELAVQVQKHVDSILTETDIKTALVIGGMSEDKQKRVLAKGPEIVIGTPGRLWQLIEEGNAHLIQLPSIDYLAIDETDRMAEKGHFEELHKLLQMVNRDASNTRQTFIFSATLTLTHELPNRLRIKKKVKTITSESKIDELIQMIGVQNKPKVVDLTTRHKTAENLSESKIFCNKDTKESYLFYFLKKFPGRTLVFCNSINCIRRLKNVFELLQCKPQTLHASKHQKQRLKSLENFTSRNRSLLLATDVAARGLDIPEVEYVIHYEVPKTTETYIHRSGRAGRASKKGLSVLLIEPAEVPKYRNIINTLERSKDLENFPVETMAMPQIKKQVELAKSIEVAEHASNQKEFDTAYISKMAEAAELGVQESDYDAEDDGGTRKMNKKVAKKRVQADKMQLKNLLKTPTSSETIMNNYNWHNGFLVPKSKPKKMPEPATTQLCAAVSELKGSKPVKESVLAVKKNKERSAYSLKAAKIRKYQSFQRGKR